MIIWSNGEYYNNSDFCFSLQDRVRYGDGIFDTMLSVNGQIIFLHEHLQRFFLSAKMLNIPIFYDETSIKDASLNIIKSNNLINEKSAINIILTRGESRRILMPPDEIEPQIIICATQTIASKVDQVHAIISTKTRKNEKSPLSNIKSFNYGDSILGLLEAKEKQANEAIFLNTSDKIAGASTSNVYVMKDGRLKTPLLSDGAMNGIIRKKLLDRGFAVEMSITLNDIHMSEGLFLSNSINGLYPVAILDNIKLPIAKMPVDEYFHTKISF